MYICGRPNVARNACTKDRMATHVAHTLFIACLHATITPHIPHFLLPHKRGKDSWKQLQRLVELSPLAAKALAKPDTAIPTHSLLHEPPVPITQVIPTQQSTTLAETPEKWEQDIANTVEHDKCIPNKGSIKPTI
eukprot:3486365-Ditylum_brightwellii.AAC.1